MPNAKEVVLAHISATADVLELVLNHKPGYSAKLGSRFQQIHQAVIEDLTKTLRRLENYALWVMEPSDIPSIIVQLNELRNRFIAQTDLRKEIEEIIGSIESLG